MKRNNGPVIRLAVAVMLGALALTGIAVAPAGAATGSDNPQVCAPLSSGKIDVEGSVTSITYTAPAGYLIDGYCVKAGSVNNDNGPVYVEVNPPATSVTITYPNGKDISHYSVSLVKTTTPPPPSTQCPDGTNPGDSNGDGTANQADCGYVPPTPPNPPTPTCPGGTPWVDTNMNGLMDECGTTPTPPTPPFSCPTGYFYAGDLNGNHVMDEGDCQAVPVPPTKLVSAKAKKSDKCGVADDKYGVKASKFVRYTADGKRVKREGVWISTQGDDRVVIKAFATNGAKLVGPRKWVFKFGTKPCGTVPTEQAPSGAKRVA